MKQMHSLLEQQIINYFKNPDAIPAEWKDLVNEINQAYWRLSRDREMLERLLKISSQKLLQANSEMRAVFRAFPDLLFRTDREGTILDHQTSGVTTLPFLKEKMIGKKIHDLFPENIKEKFREAVSQVKDANLVIGIEYAVSEKNRKYFCEARFLPLLENQIIVIIRDITDRKLADEALRESEELYRILADKSFAGVYVVQDGKFCFFNSNAASYTGYTLEELIGKESLSIVFPEDREQLKSIISEMLHGERTLPYEFRIITKEGRVRWLMETVTSILWKGKRAVLGNCMDLTERKRMEEEIRSLSITDFLTGLHNRRGFLNLVEQQLKFSDRHKRDTMLFFADLDGLKRINDTLGHEEGDKALIAVTGILQETFRSSDIIARVGGDEFAILAIDTVEISPEIIMTRLQKNIDHYNNKGSRGYKIAISMGTSYYDPENPCSVDELMSRADKMMYEHKRSKKALNARTY